jgi:uncharacterized protein
VAAPEPLPGSADVTVERDVACRVRDGVALLADVYRPAAGGPHPVLLIRSPYGKAGGQSDVAYAHPSWYARQGYVVVVQDSRGRWASEGDWYPFLHEAQDGFDTVEWAARLPGADGRVAMYGFSYAGATQLLAATLRPPSLAAIAPALTGSQCYDGWTYNGGAFALAFVSSWAVLLALGEAARRGDAAKAAALAATLGDAPRQYWTLPVEDFPGVDADIAPYYRDWLAHPTYDDYWRRWSVDEDYARVAVPALHVGGLYDVFLSGTVANFTALRRQAGDEAARRAQKLVLAPLTHMPWTPTGAPGPGPDGRDAGANALDDWMVRYYDEVLKGRDTGALDAPATVYVLGAGWRDFDDWPPPATRPTDWFLHSAGRANTAAGDGTLAPEPPGDEPPDLYIHDPSDPVLSQGGHSCCIDRITPMGPACQCAGEARKAMLVYTSTPLARDLDLVGDVTVTLHAVTSARDTDFVARLCVVGADGCSRNLQEGILRASFRDSLSHPTSIEPGRAYEYTIALGPVAARVPAGSRLRLDVASSDFPQWDRGIGGILDALPATQTVLHDRAHASRVTLPVLA